MARKRGFIAADPTAWKAIGWADKELAKKELGPRPEPSRKPGPAFRSRDLMQMGIGFTSQSGGKTRVNN